MCIPLHLLRAFEHGLDSLCQPLALPPIANPDLCSRRSVLNLEAPGEAGLYLIADTSSLASLALPGEPCAHSAEPRAGTCSAAICLQSDMCFLFFTCAVRTVKGRFSSQSALASLHGFPAPLRQHPLRNLLSPIRNNTLVKSNFLLLLYKLSVPPTAPSLRTSH